MRGKIQQNGPDSLGCGLNLNICSYLVHRVLQYSSRFGNARLLTRAPMVHKGSFVPPLNPPPPPC
jgi:hypothetical protein